MSGLIDRFICRREGHKPALELAPASWYHVTSLVTTCVRCGKVLKSPAAAPPDSKEATK